ncbi:MAG: VOC family protein [Candidatus Curtissbacteria bacterium]|nr:VOC family protein [Candidatus Curtissbacteria bacterium]
MMDSVVHFEIPTDDLARANKFYSSAFGWNMISETGHDYVLVMTAESDEKGPKERARINGGMLKRQGPITNIVITINVDDIDEALRKIEEAGGKTIRGKQPVGEAGFAAYFTDTEGNVVGLWENASKS